MKVLLTGGAGFIGSHTAVELINGGFDVVIADNYSNSSPDVVGRIEKIIGGAEPYGAAGAGGATSDGRTSPDGGRGISAYNIDVCDKAAVRDMFAREDIGAVIHFAGHKAVGESVEKPLMYYRNNLDSAMTVLEVMKEFGVDVFVFSSSATVYGELSSVPFTEEAPTGCTNPYGWTKWMIEQMLMDAARADENERSAAAAGVGKSTGEALSGASAQRVFTPILLRYFNPVGAHESGLIGENPRGIPNNLMPFIQQVAAGRRERLSVFGDDYDTPDGTGVRDYIHVVDLAKGHVKALEYAMEHPGLEIFNLGTGKGSSVLEVVRAFEAAASVPVPYVMAPRRPGDLDVCYANAGKAKRLLGWEAEKSLEDMCRDAWRWQQYCTEHNL